MAVTLVPCEKCGKSISPNGVKCPDCGALNQKHHECKTCKEMIPVTVRECTSCGEAQGLSRMNATDTELARMASTRSSVVAGGRFVIQAALVLLTIAAVMVTIGSLVRYGILH